MSEESVFTFTEQLEIDMIQAAIDNFNQIQSKLLAYIDEIKNRIDND